MPLCSYRPLWWNLIRIRGNHSGAVRLLENGGASMPFRGVIDKR